MKRGMKTISLGHGCELLVLVPGASKRQVDAIVKRCKKILADGSRPQNEVQP